MPHHDLLAQCIALAALRRTQGWGGSWTVPDHVVERMVRDLVADPYLFFDMEAVPLGVELEQSDTNRVLEHLDDWVGRLMDRGIDEVEVLSGWVDAARIRGNRFYEVLLSHSAWDRAYLFREGYLDRVLAGVKVVLDLVVRTFCEDLAPIIQVPVVDAVAQDSMTALKDLWDCDDLSKSYLHVAMRDMTDRQHGEHRTRGRLESRRPPEARLGATT